MSDAKPADRATSVYLESRATSVHLGYEGLLIVMPILTAFALILLIAGCTDAFKPDATASRSSAMATATAPRAQPAASPSSGTSANPSRPGPASAGPSSTPAPQPATPPPPTALLTQLADAIRLFDAGEFFAAVGRLRNLPDLNTANVETQLLAMKYLAFSYCVTNRRTLCQQQFEAALKVDPKFELAPAERGHPIWKVYFERAKLAVANASASKGSDGSAGKPADAKTGEAKTGEAKTGEAKKGRTKKVATKASAAKSSAAQTGDAKTGDAETGDSKQPASAPKGSRKSAKAEPKTSAGAVTSPSPDQRPQ